jgi:uncharacterized membrane protein YvbJ
MKFCPDCGDAVEPGDEVCETCGAGLTGQNAVADRSAAQVAGLVAAAPAPGPGAARAGDLTPQELRKEIRWGVFQGILLAGLIVLVVYIIVMLVVFGVVANGSLG